MVHGEREVLDVCGGADHYSWHMAGEEQDSAAVGTHTRAVQRLVAEFFVGVALYSMVIGFFNDYTDLIHTGTYSATFGLAIVMQALTYIVFGVKRLFVRWHIGSGSRGGRMVRFLGVWAIVFLSKFVVLWAIEVVFRGAVEVSGFVALIVVMAAFTVAQMLAWWLYRRLDP